MILRRKSEKVGTPSLDSFDASHVQQIRTDSSLSLDDPRPRRIVSRDDEGDQLICEPENDNFTFPIIRYHDFLRLDCLHHLCQTT